MSDTKRPIGWVRCTECNVEYPVDPWNIGPKCPHCGAEDAKTMAEMPDEAPIEVSPVVLAFIIAHTPRVPANGGAPPFLVDTDDPNAHATIAALNGGDGAEVVELHNRRPASLAATDQRDTLGNAIYRGYILRIASRHGELRIVYDDIVAATLRIRGDEVDAVLDMARELIDGWYPQVGTAPGEGVATRPRRR